MRYCFALLLLSTQALADDWLDRAKNLSQRFIIADTHIDVPYRIYDEWQDVVGETTMDFDYPRAKAGGLNLPFMSIYLPWSSEVDGTAFALANRLIDQVEAIAYRAPDRFGIPYSAAQAEALIKSGRIALAMGMENGAAINGKLENLRHFHRRGIRYITLAHSRSNHISDSSYDSTRLWDGLSPFGVKLVRAMNQTGVMVDVSHISDAAFWDVMEVSSAPVIASHSSLRHFVPDWERNMSDEMVQALAKNGGVIMINFGSTFLTAAANKNHTTYAAARSGLMEQLGTDDQDDPRVQAFTEQYRSQTPFEYATVAAVADHIDHVVELVGVDYVGLGSDFDGVGDSLPIGLKDVSMYPNLIALLLKRGYAEGDIEKILGGNLMRVWKQVEAEAL
ncbi:MAG: dipeptidase [Wenzhouxiangellaceae bacterium]